MTNTLKGILKKKTLITGEKGDMMLQLISVGNLTFDDIIDRMEEQNTGLNREILEHVVRLYHCNVEAALLEGYHINTGLYCAEAQARGYINQGKWNPEKNTVHISITPGKSLRQSAAKLRVSIEQMATERRCIFSVEDTSTHATNGTATAGRSIIVKGSYIKIVGDPAQVGIVLIDDQGIETTIAQEMIAVNHPRQIILLLPEDLKEGRYRLMLTTQFSDNSKKLLKAPRVISYTIYITN